MRERVYEKDKQTSFAKNHSESIDFNQMPTEFQIEIIK